MTNSANHLSQPAYALRPRPSAAPECPGCNLADQVQHVPAAYRAGHAAWSGVNNYGIHQQGATVTSTAADLDPTASRQATSGLAVVGIIGILLGGAFAILTYSNAHDPTVTVPMGTQAEHTMLALSGIPMLGGIALIAWAIGRARHNRHLDRLERVCWHWWRYAWTCHRCGGVFIPAQADLPPTLYPGHLLNPTGFRCALWDTARASVPGQR